MQIHLLKRLPKRMPTPTSGAAIIVWVLPIVTVLLGLCWFAPDTRLQSSAFQAAKAVMPMKAWGVLFLLVGLVKLGCVARGSSESYIACMCLGAGLYAWWTVLFLAALGDPHTSFSAPVFPAGWTALHIATLSTLTGARDG